MYDIPIRLDFLFLSLFTFRFSTRNVVHLDKEIQKRLTLSYSYLHLYFKAFKLHIESLRNM